MIREVLTLDRLRAMAPDEAAATLIVRRSDGPATVDQEALEAWLGLDEANARAWARAQSVWDIFDDAIEDDTLDALRAEARGVRRAPQGPRWPRLAAAAAVFALALGGAWLVFQRSEGPERDASMRVASAPLRYETLRGEREVVTLADGSRVTLDTETMIEVDYSEARRGVALRSGRAHFEVAQQPQRPFSVTAAGREIIALGTRFDVRLDPGQLRVVLVEGRVSVAASGSQGPAAVLQPGDQFLQKDGAPPVISRVEAEEALAWREGLVMFRDDTLAEAAAELNRYSREQLLVRDPAVAGLRVSGTFRTGDAARFGRTVTEIHPVEIRNRGQGWLEIVPASGG